MVAQHGVHGRRAVAFALLLALVNADRRLELEQSQSACSKHGTDGVIIALAPERTALGTHASGMNAHGAQARAFADKLVRMGRRRLDGTKGNVKAVTILAVFKTVEAVAATITDDTILEAVLVDPEVDSVEANCIIQLDDPATDEQDDLDPPAKGDAVTTQGVQLNAPWGLDRIDSRSGRDALYNYGTSLGATSTIYVLDTGIRISHDDFGGRALAGWSFGCQTGTESSCGSTWAYQGVIVRRQPFRTHIEYARDPAPARRFVGRLGLHVRRAPTRHPCPCALT